MPVTGMPSAEIKSLQGKEKSTMAGMASLDDGEKAQQAKDGKDRPNRILRYAEVYVEIILGTRSLLTSLSCIGSICEIISSLVNTITHHWCFCVRRTYTKKLVKTGKEKSLDRKKPVLVERRIVNHKGIHTHTEVDVKSQKLREVLIDINEAVEGLSLKKEPPFVRSSPPR